MLGLFVHRPLQPYQGGLVVARPGLPMATL